MLVALPMFLRVLLCCSLWMLCRLRAGASPGPFMVLAVGLVLGLSCDAQM